MLFEQHRPRLTRIAYRMTGSTAEAEDIVQEAYLRWHASDRGAVRAPAAFLTRVVSRLALDVLKSARVRRETYPGPWLPEPIIVEEEPCEDVTLTLMVALERLSPDFQREQGYEIPAPGEANMSMSTTQLAERFGCVSMTLEMPFKDNFNLPDEVYGWSPQRSKYLAYACLDALHAILPDLKAFRDKA